MVLLLQSPQKTPPQLRQWCFRFVRVKGVLHLWHSSSSTHSGALIEVIMLLVSD